MEIRRYFEPFLRWWWVIVIATLIAGGTDYMITRNQPPVYSAKTTLMIGRSIQDPNPSTNELGISYQLTNAYADIARREPVQIATKNSLGLETLPKYEVNPLGIFLEISVTSTNPQIAQVVANELAQQLILQSPTNIQQPDQESQAFIEQQINDLIAAIQSTTDEIKEKQSALIDMVSAVEIAQTQEEISALENKLRTLQSLFADLKASSNESATNTLSVFEPASLPVSPIGPKVMLTVIVAGALGFIFATGAAYLYEFIDRTIKTPEDVERVMKIPVIGFIQEMNSKDVGGYVADNPRSPIAEAFRSLRSNIEFLTVNKPFETLLITSADISDGKTTISTNLALTISMLNKKVILIDADLRRPSVHKAFKTNNTPGLSELILNQTTIPDISRQYSSDNIKIITAGSVPPNPTELLGSEKMLQILDNLKKTADFIVIDGPPAIVTDTYLLSTNVSGVLFVMRPGQLREDKARAMIGQFKRAGANVIGVVFNCLPRRGADYYSGYQDYSPYTHDDSIKKDGKEKTQKTHQQKELDTFGKSGTIT